MNSMIHFNNIGILFLVMPILFGIVYIINKKTDKKVFKIVSNVIIATLTVFLCVILMVKGCYYLGN